MDRQADLERAFKDFLDHVHVPLAGFVIDRKGLPRRRTIFGAIFLDVLVYDLLQAGEDDGFGDGSGQ